MRRLNLEKEIQTFHEYTYENFVQMIAWKRPRMSNPKMSNPRMSNPKMSNAKMSNRVIIRSVPGEST